MAVTPPLSDPHQSHSEAEPSTLRSPDEVRDKSPKEAGGAMEAALRTEAMEDAAEWIRASLGYAPFQVWWQLEGY